MAQFSFWRSLTFLALLYLLPLPHSHAQEPPDSQVTIRRSVNLVLVDVIVSDKKGNTLGGMRAKDFEIFDETNRQQISHFSQDVIPLAIAVVVDVSGSMEPKMRPIRDGLRKALPSLKQEDRVALFSFAGRPKLILPLTRNIEELTKKIGRLGSGGNTNINDAIYTAAEYLHQVAPEARSIIILVSDTIPTSAHKMAAPEVRDMLVASEVALFGIRVINDDSPRIDRALESDNRAMLSAMLSLRIPGTVLVDKLAEVTGGFVMDVYRFKGIPAAVDTLLQIVKTRYTLGFYPNSPGAPGSTRTLDVKLKSADEVERVLPGAFLRFRNQYHVPGPEPSKPIP